MHLLPGCVPPSVVTCQVDVIANKLYPFYKGLMLLVLSAVDYVVATSPIYAQTSPVLPRSRDKLSVIPIGISTKTERPDPERLEEWRDRLGTGFLLFIGAQREFKGLQYLYRAAETSRLPVVVAGRSNGPPPMDLPETVT